MEAVLGGGTAGLKVNAPFLFLQRSRGHPSQQRGGPQVALGGVTARAAVHARLSQAPEGDGGLGRLSGALGGAGLIVRKKLLLPQVKAII